MTIYDKTIDEKILFPVGIGILQTETVRNFYNTSDATATPNDILSGKTSYGKYGMINGTLDIEGEKNASYQEGYLDGENEGFSDGYAEGLDDGKIEGREEIIEEQSDANITASTVLQGYIGYGPNNERIVGTNVGGFNFGEIGYTEEESNELNSQLGAPLNYTKSLMPVDPSTSLNRKFRGDKNLVYAPYIDTSITTNMDYMFYECSKLQYVPQYDYSNVKTLFNTFGYAGGPKEIDFSFDNNVGDFRQIMAYNIGTEKLVINAANVIYDTPTTKGYGIYGLAYGAKNIKHLEVFNIPNTVTHLDLWKDCTTLEYVRLSGDTSNVKTITSQYAFYFYNNSNLHTVILDIDTHFLTTAYSLFNGCKALTTISFFNTSNVTDMSNMFNDCQNLIEVPSFDTNKVTSATGMFYNCQSLTTVPLLNFENVTALGAYSWTKTFGYCYELINLGGFTNLGKSFTGTSNDHDLYLSNSTKLTRQSCLNVFNTIYDMNLTSVTDAKITLSSSTKALLSDEDIAIATNKGWIIS